MTTWKQFVGLFLLGSLALASIAVFVVTVDYDHHYVYEREVAEFPRDVERIEYDALSPEERRVVEEAMESGEVVMQDGSAIPDEGIERDGQKYLFSAFKSFDWTDPGTFGPTLFGLLCGFGTLRMVWRDMKRATVR